MTLRQTTFAIIREPWLEPLTNNTAFLPGLVARVAGRR